MPLRYRSVEELLVDLDVLIARLRELNNRRPDFGQG